MTLPPPTGMSAALIASATALAAFAPANEVAQHEVVNTEPESLSCGEDTILSGGELCERLIHTSTVIHPSPRVQRRLARCGQLRPSIADVYRESAVDPETRLVREM